MLHLEMPRETPAIDLEAPSVPYPLATPGRRAIFEALTGGPCAWRTPAELAAELGREPESLTDELASLDVDGWLDVWERPEGPAVTLSALAAELLRVRLAECGGFLFRWVDADRPERDGYRTAGVMSAAALEELDLVVDPSAAPDADDPAGTAWPYPTRLLGDGLSPWPGPGPVGHDGASEGPAACPCCGGRPLSAREYCLVCDRWGLDDRLRAEAARRPSRPATPRDDRAEAEKLRARRRERRRARQAALARRKTGPARACGFVGPSPFARKPAARHQTRSTCGG